MTKRIHVTEDQTIHHPFRPPESICQICGPDDELAHVWKCECGMVGNGERHVHKQEKPVQ